MIPVLLLWLAAGPDPRFFDQRVAPILTRRCLGCHNEELKNGGISFLDRESLLKGGSRGPAIVPGKPEASAMIDALRHEGQLQMPPGPALPEREIRVLREWIRRGAVWGGKLGR
ncbi:MAG: c-type cytochrome domain-containing protein [Acidobacteriota bacterium]